MIRGAPLLLSAAAGYAAAAGVFAGPLTQQADRSPQVDTQGAQLVSTACSGCHQLDLVQSARKTPTDWATTVERMIGYGAPVGEHRDVIVAYLAAHYGPGTSSSASRAAPVPAVQPPAVVTAAVAMPMTAGSRASADDCCTATGADSPKVSGNYGNQNYSSLAQITRANVSRLGGAWHLRLEGGDDGSFQQGNIVAEKGVIYAETTQGSTVAVDAATGQLKWRYKPAYGPTLRRGVALGEGKVFTLKGGNHAAALDQATGKVLWERDFSNDRTLGTMPTAITYYDGRIYFGSANSRRGAGMALDAATGQTVWTFYGTPGTGEFGNDSWAGDTWTTGGAAPWLHPAIDPKLALIYWTFGNARAGAPLDGGSRAGANLFANSIVAIDAKTGKRVWHFQSIHHDIWDMDNVMSPVLVDIPVGGRLRQAVVYGSKTAMLYILDRRTGEPIFPIVEKAVPQSAEQHTWPTQPFPTNQALASLCPGTRGAERVPPHYRTGCLFTPHLDEPTVHFPGTGGGADTSQYSYSHKTRLLYIGLGIVGIAQARTGSFIGVRPPGEERSGKIVAYDLSKGRIAWERRTEWSLAHGNGILSTAGDVLFLGQPDGYLLALDATDGRELWRFQTGAGVHTQPIAYEVGGEQYVAVLAGGNGLPYNSPKGDHLWAFKIGGTVAPASTPLPPPKRQPVTGEPIAGVTVNNMVVLGRAWTGGKPGAEELRTQSAVAPQILHVPIGTTVTFVNPSDNKLEHCATQFFEGLFDKRLKPGERFSYTFTKRGEYFFNDCAFPLATGKIVVE